MIEILDGAMGTELMRLGLPLDGPGWSARALEHAPELVRSLHESYAQAGATLHTANTFRTQPGSPLGERWVELARRAVQIAREVASSHGQRVAGSIAPLEDCYRPDLSPPDAEARHRILAEVLADAGCDLLLCETFPHPGEALVALEAAVATALPAWLSLSAGYRADLLTPEEVARTAKRAADAGASALLINCVPADRTLPYLVALRDAGLPFGAYANAGPLEGVMGWQAEPDAAAQAYLAHVRTWVEEGATIFGGCCGTGPSHIAAVARFANSRYARRPER